MTRDAAKQLPLTAQAFARYADGARRVWGRWFHVHVNTNEQTITIRPRKVPLDGR